MKPPYNPNRPDDLDENFGPVPDHEESRPQEHDVPDPHLDDPPQYPLGKE